MRGDVVAAKTSVAIDGVAMGPLSRPFGAGPGELAYLADAEAVSAISPGGATREIGVAARPFAVDVLSLVANATNAWFVRQTLERAPGFSGDDWGPAGPHDIQAVIVRVEADKQEVITTRLENQTFTLAGDNACLYWIEVDDLARASVLRTKTM